MERPVFFLLFVATFLTLASEAVASSDSSHDRVEVWCQSKAQTVTEKKARQATCRGGLQKKTHHLKNGMVKVWCQSQAETVTEKKARQAMCRGRLQKCTRPVAAPSESKPSSDKDEDDDPDLFQLHIGAGAGYTHTLDAHAYIRPEWRLGSGYFGIGIQGGFTPLDPQTPSMGFWSSWVREVGSSRFEIGPAAGLWIDEGTPLDHAHLWAGPEIRLSVGERGQISSRGGISWRFLGEQFSQGVGGVVFVSGGVVF